LRNLRWARRDETTAMMSTTTVVATFIGLENAKIEKLM
jgi:hypothetical protein